MDKIRCNSGVCPQHNILFDKLSCKEHLQVYAGIKNVPGEEVDEKVRVHISTSTSTKKKLLTKMKTRF